MSINYIYLILAIILLWMPRNWLRGGRKAARNLGLSRRTRKREFVRIRESGDNRVNVAEEFRKARNYVDFLRAMTGGLLLIGNPELGVSSCFTGTEEIVSVQSGSFVFELQVLIIAIGVIRQFVRIEGRITFFAPLFYFAGLALALCGVGAGSFAFLLVWTLNSAIPVPPVGFLNVYAASMLFALPVVVSLMARRSLALFSKKQR